MAVGYDVLIGWVLSLLVIIGGVIARDRYVLNVIQKGDDAMRKALDTETAAIHERINKAREDFVRRDDFNVYVIRLDKTLEAIVRGQETMNTRLDRLVDTYGAEQRK